MRASAISSATASPRPTGGCSPRWLRFDPVYVGHFKCNLRRIADYPNLSNYLRDLYQVPGVAETVNLHHIKAHYYGSHNTINPTRIVPVGPEIDYARAAQPRPVRQGGVMATACAMRRPSLPISRHRRPVEQLGQPPQRRRRRMPSGRRSSAKEAGLGDLAVRQSSASTAKSLDHDRAAHGRGGWPGG